MNPGESPADAIVRHLSGVRARELWVVANDLRDKLLKIDAEIEELDSGNEDNLSDERLDELERAEEEDGRRLESVEAALERALVDASTVKTSPSKQDSNPEDEKNKAAPIATATATSPLLSSLLQSSSTSSPAQKASEAAEATEDATSEVTAVESKVEGDLTAKSTAEMESASSEVAASDAIKMEEEGEEMVDVEKDNKGWVHQSRETVRLDIGFHQIRPDLRLNSGLIFKNLIENQT